MTAPSERQVARWRALATVPQRNGDWRGALGARYDAVLALAAHLRRHGSDAEADALCKKTANVLRDLFEEALQTTAAPISRALLGEGGVMGEPEFPLSFDDPLCDAPGCLDPLHPGEPSLRCQLKAGHEGQHLGYLPVRWEVSRG